MNFKLLKYETYKKQNWKNGKGVTSEIYIWPLESDLNRGNFHWRMSTATISESNAFSHFPNHQRVLIILNGEGVRLTHLNPSTKKSQSLNLLPLSIHFFSGSNDSHCQLLNPSQTINDFNIIYDPQKYKLNIKVCHADNQLELTIPPSSGSQYFFIVEGAIKGDQIHALKNDTLCLTGMGPWKISSSEKETTFLWIQISPVDKLS